MRCRFAVLFLAAALCYRLSSAQASVPTNFNLPEGTTAISIGSGAVPAGATIELGEHVDILAAYQDSGTHQPMNKVVVQGVIVLAIGSGSITLAVETQQVKLIQAADRAGALIISARPPAITFSQLRELALDELKERFPNVDPSCFLYQGTMTDLAAGRNYTEATVVFTDCHSPIKYAKGPKQDGQAVPIVSGIEYCVRIKRDGEVIGIERHEHDDGVLEITPAPDQGIQSRVPAPPIAPPLHQIPLPLVQTNRMIIIRPESVPQTLP